MSNDFYHNSSFANAYNSATIGANGTTNGNTIDTKGFGSLTFVISNATRTDGTFTPLIQESDNSDMSAATDVADANLLNTEALAAITATNSNKAIGVVLGNKRYVRLSIVATGVTTGTTGLHATAILTDADRVPTV